MYVDKNGIETFMVTIIMLQESVIIKTKIREIDIIMYLITSF